jgi:hypothetical protein
MVKDTIKELSNKQRGTFVMPQKYPDFPALNKKLDTGS